MERKEKPNDELERQELQGQGPMERVALEVQGDARHIHEHQLEYRPGERAGRVTEADGRGGPQDLEKIKEKLAPRICPDSRG